MHREEADPSRLYDAVRSRDLTSLLQLYAEGADLSKPLVLPDGQVKHEIIFHLYLAWNMQKCPLVDMDDFRGDLTSVFRFSVIPSS